MVDVIVLGAGIVGVSTALQLKNRGADVVLLDNAGPDAAASFGNAGVLQSEAMEPYAMPRDLITLFRMMLGRHNGLLYDLPGLWDNAAALGQYWRNSRPALHRHISGIYAALIVDALRDHERLIAQAGAGHLIRRTGYLALSQSSSALDAAAAHAQRLGQTYGVPSRTLAADQLSEVEPGLRMKTGGAIHWTDPWSVSDPGALVRAYEQAFVAMGGERDVGDAASLRRASDGAWQVKVQGGKVAARHVVVSTGAASPDLARSYGHRFRLVRKRGYHQHFDIGQPLMRPVVVEQSGFVLAPMDRGLRLATGAALQRKPEMQSVQLEKAKAIAETLLQRPMSPASEIWTGVRPCRPNWPEAAYLGVIWNKSRTNNVIDG